MKFTKAQSAIIEEIAETNEIANWHQRLRAIRPLEDAGVIKHTAIYDKDGFFLGKKWELV